MNKVDIRQIQYNKGQIGGDLMKNLNDLKLGEEARINNICCNETIARRLMDLGIVENTKITPILKSPSGNPRAYEVRGSVIAIRCEEAENIGIK